MLFAVATALAPQSRYLFVRGERPGRTHVDARFLLESRRNVCVPGGTPARVQRRVQARRRTRASSRHPGYAGSAGNGGRHNHGQPDGSRGADFARASAGTAGPGPGTPAQVPTLSGQVPGLPSRCPTQRAAERRAAQLPAGLEPAESALGRQRAAAAAEKAPPPAEPGPAAAAAAGDAELSLLKRSPAHRWDSEQPRSHIGRVDAQTILRAAIAPRR